jgi:hypothetical protein
MSDELNISLTQHISEAVLAAVRGTPALNCGADPATMGRHEEMLRNIIAKLEKIDNKLDDGNAKFESTNTRLTKLETEKTTAVAMLAGAISLIISIGGMLFKK